MWKWKLRVVGLELRICAFNWPNFWLGLSLIILIHISISRKVSGPLRSYWGQLWFYTSCQTSKILNLPHNRQSWLNPQPATSSYVSAYTLETKDSTVSNKNQILTTSIHHFTLPPPPYPININVNVVFISSLFHMSR